MRLSPATALPILLLAVAGSGAAQSSPSAANGYLTPPQEIVDILDAPPTPSVIVGPTRDVIVLVEQRTMPPIGWLARPLERLAGYRIDPRNSGPWRAPEISALGVRRLDGVSDEASAGDGGARIDAPRGTTLGWPEFSPDGSHLSYAVLRDTGIELWVVDIASRQPRPLTVASLNATWGNPCEWLFDSTGVLCRFRRSARGTPPSRPRQPDGPNIQEHAGGRAAPVRTYQDLLANPHDEALFEYHFTSQIETVALATGARTAIGEPGLYARVSAAPDSRHMLIERLVRPFSWLHPASRFARSVEVWTLAGDAVTLATLPLADAVPIGGVPTGPRGHRWNPTSICGLFRPSGSSAPNPRPTRPWSRSSRTTARPCSPGARARRSPRTTSSARPRAATDGR